MLGNSSCFCCRLLIFISKSTFSKKFFQYIVTLPECQTVWIQIRTDVLSVLIWVQTVCKGSQPTTNSPHARKVHFHVAILLESIYFYCKFLIALRYNDQELFTLRCSPACHIFGVWNKSPVGCS